jgi:ABC-type sulfate/molybdate transport systems ATPase subunit
LVSHHVELLLPVTDYIVRVLDGRIDAQGTPAELRASGELEGLIAIEGAEAAAEEPVTSSSSSQDQEIKVTEEEDAPKKEKKKRGPGKKLVQGKFTSQGRVLTRIDEERPVGNVKWQTYKLYIVAATYLTWALTIMALSESNINVWLQES